MIQDTVVEAQAETQKIYAAFASYEELKQAALDWVNLIRAEHGHDALDKLPKGDHGFYTCPISQALTPLGKMVSTSTNAVRIWTPEVCRILPLPALVKRFVSEYDNKNLDV